MSPDPTTGPTPPPTAEAFAALAGSSPWRWRTLHFRHRADGRELEAWVRRPGWLRVVEPDGTERIETGVPYTQSVWSVDEHGRREEREPQWLTPTDVEPELRPDGLVARRPDDHRIQYDDPMYGNFTWVAMLDPAELAHHVDVDRQRAEELFGRLVWRADLRPRLGYAPRCGGGCCELLVSRAGWLADDLDDVSQARPVPDDLVFPDHHDVALDVETGIVVRLHAVGGTRGESSENQILEVG